jgi:hypothetical protein
MSDDLVERLRSCSPLNIALAHEAANYIEELEGDRDAAYAADLYEAKRAVELEMARRKQRMSELEALQKKDVV